MLQKFEEVENIKVCNKILQTLENSMFDIQISQVQENHLLSSKHLKMANHISEVASQILPSQDVDIIAYGCTSGTIAIGSDRIKKEINKTKPKAKVTTPITAAMKAFNHLGLKNIAVLTPYPKDVNVTVYNYLIDNNINIESFSSFNLEYDSEIAQVSLASLEKEIKKIDLSNVDGLFVSCTALKIVDVLDRVERSQNTIVISSNLFSLLLLIFVLIFMPISAILISVFTLVFFLTGFHQFAGLYF